MDPLNGQKFIFMPGMDGTGISFDPLSKLLPSNITVTVVRYPTDRCYSFEETVQCAKAQIESSQDSIILAESFSGPIAIKLIGSGQLKAKCIILCSSFARSPRPIWLKIISCLPLQLLTKFLFRKFILKFIIEDDDQIINLYLDMWKKINSKVPVNILTHRLKLIDQVDVRIWLPKLTVPCFYIRATNDKAVPVSSLFDFTEAVPDLRVRSINGPHFILQAQPHASMAAIRDFISLVKVSHIEV